MSTVFDPRIDAYIARAAPFARPVLERLREMVHAGCPAVTETIKWGMPHFEYAGRILCSMAAFKAHCAFGFWHRGMADVVVPAATPGAMGSFGRITSLRDLPDETTMTRYVRTAAQLNESGTPGRARAAGSANSAREVALPADLAAALKRNARAAKTFGGFSPSHRKEYVAWIEGAKREATRQKRIATTLEWLAQGKRRDWKYQKPKSRQRVLQA